MNDIQIQRSLSLFAKGCNCAQAVLVAFGPELGFSEEQCMKLAAAFGGGIARRAELCGAVSGALMAIGLQHAKSPIENPDAKAETYELAQRFISRFTEEHGSPICEKLLGCHIGTPEGRQQAMEANLHQTRCERFVKTAIQLVTEL
ncbi:MAG TPA: C-GCAxxG-C-C family protein [Armatimonadota bacterium]|nr:C-GCAxxG-C-C family protein [Armatimonadota bacterium]